MASRRMARISLNNFRGAIRTRFLCLVYGLVRQLDVFGRLPSEIGSNESDLDFPSSSIRKDAGAWKLSARLVDGPWTFGKIGRKNPYFLQSVEQTRTTIYEEGSRISNMPIHIYANVPRPAECGM